MNNIKFFEKNKYCLVEGAISKEAAEIITQYTLFDEKKNPTPVGFDMQVPNSHSKYGDTLMESLLQHLLPTMEKNTGLSLFPSYSYYRVYRFGNSLAKHKDRESCEISATLCLGYKYSNNFKGWPILIEDAAYIMEPGDMIIYKGTELYHSRPKFYDAEDSFHSQVFLHYVDKNGQYSDFKFDKREGLGLLK